MERTAPPRKSASGPKRAAAIAENGQQLAEWRFDVKSRYARYALAADYVISTVVAIAHV